MCVCALGQYLVERILKDGAALGLTLAFVWNRNSDKLKGLVPDELILSDLSSFATRCKYTHTHTNNIHLNALASCVTAALPTCSDVTSTGHVM